MDTTESPQPLVGLDAYSLTGPSGHEICENDIFTMLRTVQQLGADGLQATLPDDPSEIDAAFALASDLHLYLEPYVQIPVHWKNDREEIERRARRFPLICKAAARHGVHALHCTMGARERFEDLRRWEAYVQAIAEALIQSAPLLRDLDLRIGIENHWDFTTYNVQAIVDRAGADIVGAGLDTGNLLILGEAPESAIERVASITVTSHLKDAMLFSTASGAARPIVPIGEGQAAVAQAVRALVREHPTMHFTIEDHPVIYPVDYFESWWLDAVPELTTADVATLARLAREGDHWLSEHALPEPRAVELIPWSIRGPGRLRSDIETVRALLHAAVAETSLARGGA